MALARLRGAVHPTVNRVVAHPDLAGQAQHLATIILDEKTQQHSKRLCPTLGHLRLFGLALSHLRLSARGGWGRAGLAGQVLALLALSQAGEARARPAWFLGRFCFVHTVCQPAFPIPLSPLLPSPYMSLKRRHLRV